MKEEKRARDPLPWKLSLKVQTHALAVVGWIVTLVWYWGMMSEDMPKGICVLAMFITFFVPSLLVLLGKFSSSYRVVYPCSRLVTYASAAAFAFMFLF